MPCECDGFGDDSLSKITDENERLTKELCRARAIIHKLLACANGLDDKTAAKANNEVRLLLEHKRAEVKNDVERAKGKRLGLQNKIREIRKLGGEPGKKLLDAIQEWTDFIESRSNLTDEQLLA